MSSLQLFFDIVFAPKNILVTVEMALINECRSYLDCLLLFPGFNPNRESLPDLLKLNRYHVSLQSVQLFMNCLHADRLGETLPCHRAKIQWRTRETKHCCYQCCHGNWVALRTRSNKSEERVRNLQWISIVIHCTFDNIQFLCASIKIEPRSIYSSEGGGYCYVSTEILSIKCIHLCFVEQIPGHYQRLACRMLLMTWTRLTE